MKNLRKSIAIILAVLIAVAMIPLGLFTFAAGGSEVTVFSADPARVGEEGAKATSTGLSDTSWVQDEVKVGKDGESATYTWTVTFDGQTGVQFRKASFKTGFTADNVPWMSDAKVIDALSGHVTISFKARITGEDLPSSGYDSTFWVLPFDETSNRSANWSLIAKTPTVGKADGWKTISVKPTTDLIPFGSGEFFMQFSLKANNITKPVTWEIKDLALTVNSDDKDTINAALSASGSVWTFDSIVAAYENRNVTGNDDEIFVADPTRVGETGADATSTGLTDTSWVQSSAYVGKDGETATYTWSKDFDGANGTQTVRTAVKTGFTAENLPWIADSAVLDALEGRVKISFKARVSGADLPSSGYDTTLWVLPFDKSSNRVANWSAVNNSVKATGIGKGAGWKEITLTPDTLIPFGSGELFIQYFIKSTNVQEPITWEIADITFTVNSAFKNDINNALSAAGSLWTYDTIVAAFENRNGVVTEDVIFSANPERVGEEGTDATSTGLSDTSWVQDSAYVGKDGETATYKWSYDFDGSEGLQYRKTAVKLGYTAEQLAWISDPDVINALSGKVKLSFKARVSGTDLPTSGYDTTLWVLPFDKSANRVENWSYINKTATIGKSEGWKEISLTPQNLIPFGSGEFFVQYFIKSTGVNEPITWEIADIELSVSSVFKSEIDSALTAAGSEWTYEKILEAYADRDLPPVESKLEVIWDADPDKYDMAAGGNATATFSNVNASPVDVYKGYGDKGAYFTSTIDFTGKNSSGASDFAVVDGYNYTEYTYGWTQLPEIMNVLVKYAYGAADFRVSGENLPNSLFYLSLAGKYSTQVGKKPVVSVSVSGNGDWQSIPYTKMAELGEAPNNGWYYSGWRYHLYAPGSEKFNDEVKIDVRGFRLALDRKDRLAINRELKDLASLIDEQKMNYFLKGATVGTDEKGNPDYFELLVRHDAVSAWGERSDDEHSVILAGKTAGEGKVEMYVNENRFISGDKVTLNTSVEAGYKITAVTVKDENGNPVSVNADAANKTYSFTMPDGDVTAAVSSEKIPVRDFTWLAYANAGAQHSTKQPVLYGATTKTVVGDERSSAYRFDVADTGRAMVYTTQNVGIALGDYLDKAEVIVNLKLETATNNKTVIIGAENSTKTYNATVNSEWTEVRFPLSAVYGGSLNFVFSFEGLAVGDKLYVGNIYVLNDKYGLTESEMYDKIFDMSGYEKHDTNTLLGLVADPEGSVTPWNVTREDKVEEQKDVINWDIAWYAPFQYISPYIVSPEPEDAGDNYNLVFFQAEKFKEPLSKYADTGYVEFFINAATDGTTVPFLVYESASPINNEAVFTVRYDKSKARDDGFMRVQIPLTFFTDNGFSLSDKLWVSIKGNQIIADFFYMSSWRFYDRYADVPEPVQVTEEEPDERDIPLTVDTSVLNCRLDTDNMVLYVPQGTQIWELLSAITLDTDECNVEIFGGDGFIEDDSTLITEDMSLLIYRKGAYLTQFAIQFIKTVVEEQPETVPDEEPDETPDKAPDTDANAGDGEPKSQKDNFPLTVVIIAGAAVIAVGAVVFILIRRKKK